MKKNMKNILIIVILCMILGISFINSETIIQEFISYSLLFLQKLFPPSFLFFTISSLLIDYHLVEIIQKNFHIHSTYFYIFIMSLISGFPSGSIYIKEMLEKKQISIEEANQMIKYAHFPNPIFTLHMTSSLIHNQKIPIYLLLSILISNLIIFLITPKYKTNNKKEIIFPKDFSTSLKKAINHSINSIVIIYGISIIFSLISYLITSHIHNKNIYVLLSGLFDLTKGITTTALLQNDLTKAFYILLFITLGSLSIHMQTKSILQDTSIKYTSFLKGRIIGSIISQIVFSLFIIL